MTELARTTHTLAYPWTVVEPPVYRYMPQEFIDRFFETGALRLSSFPAFTKHEDEERLDVSEGEARVTVGGRGGMIQAVVSVGTGYVLSGSLVEDVALMGKFGGGCFRIENTLDFAAVVAKSLARFDGGFQGPCRYVTDKNLRKREDGVLEKIQTPEGKLKADKLFQWVAELGGPSILFMKHKKYSHQAEYRFIWKVRGPIDDFIDVMCPEAVEFCSRIT